MNKLKINKKTLEICSNIFYPLLALALVLAVWAICAKAYNKPIVLPEPGITLKTFFLMFGEKYFWVNIGWSILRSLICFVISFALALILASLGNICKPINKVLAPIITILRAAPTVAVILIMYAFMANDKLAIVVGLLIAFPILYSAFYSAIENVDKDLIEMAKIYKVRPIDRILSIYLPSVTPTLFDMSKSTLSLTFKVVVASEILTSIPMSIGTSIKQAQNIFDMEYLLAWTIASIVIAFILEGIVSLSKFIWRKTR